VGVFVRLNPGQSLSLDDMCAHFKAAGVSIQKTPEHLVIVEDFPRTPTGKVIKPDLRRRAAEMAKAADSKVSA
jgi:non-ribosomal peptide synthetase component E (peptide arylation enzyme)